MRQALRPHPNTPGVAVERIDVDIVRRSPRELALTYIVTGAISEIALPSPAPPVRADDLWRRTCFEAFIRFGSGEGYLEFNFAPSGAWAAYRFDAYRAGMRVADEIAPPRIEATTTDRRFDLAVTVDLGEAAWGAVCRLGLSAVIEETSGVKSYWALAHPPGIPDFHHSRAFVLDVALPESP
ncbi:MAG TPA: DOMON-like domain-containing protein [Caulobacteraceae bacterium]